MSVGKRQREGIWYSGDWFPSEEFYSLLLPKNEVHFLYIYVPFKPRKFPLLLRLQQLKCKQTASKKKKTEGAVNNLAAQRFANLQGQQKNYFYYYLQKKEEKEERKRK